MTTAVSDSLLPLLRNILKFAESMKGCRLEIFGEGGYVAARSKKISEVSVIGRVVYFEIPRIKNVEVRKGTRYTYFRIVKGSLVFTGTVGDDLILADYNVSDKRLKVHSFGITFPDVPVGFYEALEND